MAGEAVSLKPNKVMMLLLAGIFESFLPARSNIRAKSVSLANIFIKQQLPQPYYILLHVISLKRQKEEQAGKPRKTEVSGLARRLLAHIA